jgi:Transglycosylase-like domain/LysM domain
VSCTRSPISYVVDFFPILYDERRQSRYLAAILGKRRKRQAKSAYRAFSLAAVLMLFALFVGGIQLSIHGARFFVFRESGAGETGPNSGTDAQFLAREHTVADVKTLSANRFQWHSILATSAAGFYTVRRGDSLSSIAQAVYGNQKYWPVLYWANHPVPVEWADIIQIGEVLRLPPPPKNIPAPPILLAPIPPPAPAAPPVQATNTPVQQQPATQPIQTSSMGGNVNPADFSGFEQCVISRESGGNPQVMNSSGHYGLFQFSFSTWVGYGGAPGAFGDASAAQQEAVFATAMASPGGEDNWAPYDGC